MTDRTISSLIIITKVAIFLLVALTVWRIVDGL